MDKKAGYPPKVYLTGYDSESSLKWLKGQPYVTNTTTGGMVPVTTTNANYYNAAQAVAST